MTRFFTIDTDIRGVLVFISYLEQLFSSKLKCSSGFLAVFGFLCQKSDSCQLSSDLTRSACIPGKLSRVSLVTFGIAKLRISAPQNINPPYISPSKYYHKSGSVYKLPPKKRYKPIIEILKEYLDECCF